MDSLAKNMDRQAIKRGPFEYNSWTVPFACEGLVQSKGDK
jgi:hypothetical protein